MPVYQNLKVKYDFTRPRKGKMGARQRGTAGHRPHGGGDPGIFQELRAKQCG